MNIRVIEHVADGWTKMNRFDEWGVPRKKYVIDCDNHDNNFMEHV